MQIMRQTQAMLRQVRSGMRFGEDSREAIRLLRLEIDGEGRNAQCEWLLRPVDPWDVHLSQAVRNSNESCQALRDAIEMRRRLFRSFPSLQQAQLRAHRNLPGGGRELILAGAVSRDDEAPARIPSLVMRAKLYGFRFLLSDGALRAIHPDYVSFGY